MNDNFELNLGTIVQGHHNVTYRGIRALKNPFDYLLYQMLIFDFRPDLIVEIGTNRGGGSLYLADLLDLVGHGLLHTVDIKKQSVELLTRHKRIEIFTKGWEHYDPTFLKRFERVLIIEDSSHTYENTLGVLRHFEKILKKGSYLVVEDGIIDQLPDIKDQYNGGPQRAIREFLTSNYDFQVDRYYCDFFGINTTFNPNGYLKKVK